VIGARAMILVTALLGAGGAVAQAGPAAPVAAVDETLDAARKAYNEERYADAARLFVQAAQAAPERLELYRDLARARLWAHDTAGAVAAYRVYLEAAPGAEDRDKVQAELELALRQAGETPPPAGQPPEAVRALEASRTRAVGGQFEGALAAIDEAVEAGYLGPALGDARRFVAAELARQTEAALERWWRPQDAADAALLERLAAGWKAQRGRRPLTPVEGQAEATVAGLERLRHADWPAAVEKLGPIAGADPRLRYALALALARTDRVDEAIASAETAARALDDPRPHLLLGLLLNRAGRDGSAALRRGLDLDEP
jgi:hypothetical protein